MPKQKPAPNWKPALLISLCIALLMLIWTRQKSERAVAPTPSLTSAPEPSPKRARRVGKGSISRLRAPQRGQTPCSPEAFLRCHEGDVWSEDSCGQLEHKVDDCGVQLCREAECEAPDPTPCVEPSEGRCDGDRVRLCHAGRLQVLDCAARGMRCFQGDEGAECGPVLTREERCEGATRCSGDVLLTCVGDRRERVDCAALGGRCESLAPGETPRCVQRKLPVPGETSCGACGCPALRTGEQACDGRDEDADRHVDEGLSCGPVPIVAFVIADDSGESSFGREEIEGELAHANGLLASEPEQPELRFVLSELIVVRAASLLELSARELSEAAFAERFHPPREAFYVPVLYTDQLFSAGEVPRIGASTLPNGYCGGVQRGRGPPVGIVGIAKARSRTTLLHELGHFLGLCHTHDLTFGLQTLGQDSLASAPVLCDERCRHEGDGLCDTPPDPGPEGCRYDLACRPLCLRGEAPDAANLMSYYTPCRERFSPEQRRTVEHTLALRRAWHACLSRDCACELMGDDCPVGMTCRPSSSDIQRGRCALAGARPARAPCETNSECGEHTICLGEASGRSRCVRPCRSTRPDCTCVETSLGLSVCREDLT